MQECPSTVARDLINLVQSQPAHDDREALHKNHILRFLAASTNPMDRTILDPGHITGSAFIASDDGHHVLLIHHAKLNRWLQPGGHCEAGETDARDVARREAQEEVGVITDPDAGELFDVDVHTIPARGDQPAHFHFDLRYLFLVPQRSVTAADEVLDAKWFDLDEAERITNEHGLRRMINKLRNRFSR